MGGHDNNIIYFLSSELSSDLMSFKKLEWELEDNQVHTKYYIYNDRKQHNPISWYWVSTHYIPGIVLGAVNTERNKIKQIELGHC